MLLCMNSTSKSVMQSTVIVAAPGSKSFDGNLFYFGANSSSGILTSQTANDGINETMRYQYEGMYSILFHFNNDMYRCILSQ